MQMHLDEISRTVALGAHAILILDQAGWHTNRQTQLARQYLADAAAAAITRIEPPRKCLAISAPALPSPTPSSTATTQSSKQSAKRETISSMNPIA